MDPIGFDTHDHAHCIADGIAAAEERRGAKPERYRPGQQLTTIRIGLEYVASAIDIAAPPAAPRNRL